MPYVGEGTKCHWGQFIGIQMAERAVAHALHCIADWYGCRCCLGKQGYRHYWKRGASNTLAGYFRTYSVVMGVRSLLDSVRDKIVYSVMNGALRIEWSRRQVSGGPAVRVGRGSILSLLV